MRSNIYCNIHSNDKFSQALLSISEQDEPFSILSVITYPLKIQAQNVLQTVRKPNHEELTVLTRKPRVPKFDQLYQKNFIVKSVERVSNTEVICNLSFQKSAQRFHQSAQRQGVEDLRKSTPLFFKSIKERPKLKLRFDLNEISERTPTNSVWKEKEDQLKALYLPQKKNRKLNNPRKLDKVETEASQLYGLQSVINEQKPARKTVRISSAHVDKKFKMEESFCKTSEQGQIKQIPLFDINFNLSHLKI